MPTMFNSGTCLFSDQDGHFLWFLEKERSHFLRLEEKNNLKTFIRSLRHCPNNQSLRDGNQPTPIRGRFGRGYVRFKAGSGCSCCPALPCPAPFVTLRYW